MDMKAGAVADWLYPEAIEATLRAASCDAGRVREVLAKAREQGFL